MSFYSNVNCGSAMSRVTLVRLKIDWNKRLPLSKHRKLFLRRHSCWLKNEKCAKMSEKKKKRKIWEHFNMCFLVSHLQSFSLCFSAYQLHFFNYQSICAWLQRKWLNTLFCLTRALLLLQIKCIFRISGYFFLFFVLCARFHLEQRSELVQEKVHCTGDLLCYSCLELYRVISSAIWWKQKFLRNKFIYGN